MKILVFSDTHGSVSGLKRAIAYHPDAALVFFLGDGYREIDTIKACLPNAIIYAVRGNCDIGAYELEEELLLTSGNKRFFLCHGHTRHVKYGLHELQVAAEARCVDLALFGHTHSAYLSYVSDKDHPYYLMNPGSLSRSPDGRAHYGIIDLVDGALFCSNAVLPE